jgi:2-succinyl-5-enolpyruvyl-6-hydroxy-3-cyclohexene-1-carboxylate synthase
LEPNRFEQLFGTPHNVDFEKLVEGHGIPCVTVKTVAQLKDAVAIQGSRVIVVNTDRQKNVNDHDAVYAAVAKALRVE